MFQLLEDTDFLGKGIPFNIPDEWEKSTEEDNMGEKIIRVNMTTLTTAIEAVPADWAALGGRALTSTIVAKEVPPTCEPLGKYNKLVFAPGLLTATVCANSGRLSAGFKSPLSGTIKESNAAAPQVRSWRNSASRR